MLEMAAVWFMEASKLEKDANNKAILVAKVLGFLKNVEILCDNDNTLEPVAEYAVQLAQFYGMFE
jgi:hypothetical protein